ncbi:MAG TPA: lipocalin-like domain-containing protein [Candidatus Acidoferrales bacterium]|nr:lipocalin-like domain-containing protein [Candidatus Acidoferrales bacterium]
MDRIRARLKGESASLFTKVGRVVVLAAAYFLLCAFVYQTVAPGRKIAFPRDHFSHPDFKTEWWYYTGHLQAENGEAYGYQVTFFRYGLRDRQPRDAENPPLFTDLYLAHFALSDKRRKSFRFYERANRGYGGKAGAETDRYLVWNEDWKVEGKGDAHWIRAGHPDTRLTLELRPLKPPVLHGRTGFSQKGEGEGNASYYYSLTRLATSGELAIGGKRLKVRGVSWMDHEFSSNQLAENQVGWDWFSLQLDDQTEVMLYQLRRSDGAVDPYSSGTIVAQNGSSRHLTHGDFRVEALERWKSPKSGAVYPMKWKVTIPSESIEMTVTPFFPAQELETRKSTQVTYWEGAASVTGRRGQTALSGLAYVEMTGYAGKLKI